MAKRRSAPRCWRVVWSRSRSVPGVRMSERRARDKFARQAKELQGLGYLVELQVLRDGEWVTVDSA